MVPKAACTCPARRSVIAGPVPLYGMCVMWMPAAWLNTSKAMCCGVPLPGVLWLSLPGLAFASAINSFRSFAATEGCTTSTIGTEAASATGAKSFSMSNGSLA